MAMRRQLFHEDPKMKKKHPEWDEPESELEENDQIVEFEEEYYKEKKKELTEGWERTKKTLEETGGTAEDIATRKEKVDKKLEELEEDYAIWCEYRPGKKAKGGYAFRGKEKGDRKEYTAEQLVKLIEKQTETISKVKLKFDDKDNLKTVSLTTRYVWQLSDMSAFKPNCSCS
jgi:DNA topoisomerase-1